MKYVIKMKMFHFNCICVGGLCKDSSGSGLKQLLSARILTLDRILIQSDSPFMYPNARAANLSDTVKSSLTQRYI